MPIVKVAELESCGLDYWVARADGWEDANNGRPMWLRKGNLEAGAESLPFSEKWELGGPIIEREGVSIVCVDPQCWGAASFDERSSKTGQTPLIAAMRCYVASRFGAEFDPEAV